MLHVSQSSAQRLAAASVAGRREELGTGGTWSLSVSVNEKGGAFPPGHAPPVIPTRCSAHHDAPPRQSRTRPRHEVTVPREVLAALKNRARLVGANAAEPPRLLGFTPRPPARNP